MNEVYIGKTLTVTESKNPTQTKLKGKIMMETKNTFTIRTENGDKTLLKKGSIFMIGNKKVDGSSVQKRPEERIKISTRRK